jgi:hypothetical protein
MRQREFIVLQCSASGWPLGAHAQQTAKIAWIGFLIPSAPEAPARSRLLRLTKSLSGSALLKINAFAADAPSWSKRNGGIGALPP